MKPRKPNSLIWLRISLILTYAALLYGVGCLLYDFPSYAASIAAMTGFPQARSATRPRRRPSSIPPC